MLLPYNCNTLSKRAEEQTMRKRTIYVVVAMCYSLVACDEGRIYEMDGTAGNRPEGYVLKLTGQFRGIGEWSDGYSVVAAGFGESGGEYVLAAKTLPTEAGEEELTLLLGGLGSEVDNLRLCVVNRLRECVVSFMSMEAPTVETDTVRMTAGTMDVGMYAAVQQGLFDAKCIQCHGSTGKAAAGLFLTSDRSYDALVNVASKVYPDQILVRPGHAEESFLHQTLCNNESTAMRHLDLFSEKEQVLLKLIDDWIAHGAQP